MIRVARIIAFACTATWCLTMTSGQALGAAANMATLAERSVVTVVNGGRVTTGFAFDSRTQIIGASSRRPSTVITAGGKVAASVAERETAGISAGSRPGGLPFVVDTKRPAKAERAYLLAGPVGYETGKIRGITLHFVGSSDGTRVQVRGRLPSQFLGAPVVTRRGQLLGAIAEIGTKSWTLVSVGGLTALVSGIGRSAAGSPTTAVVLIGGVLLVMLGLLGALGFRWRRRTTMRHPRATQERLTGAGNPQNGSAPRHSDESEAFEPATDRMGATPPVVRRSEESTVLDGDDFDIVIKSHESRVASQDGLERP